MNRKFTLSTNPSTKQTTFSYHLK